MPNRFPRYSNHYVKDKIDSTYFVRDYIDTSSIKSTGNYSGSPIYSYGHEYTWNAAMANTNHYVGHEASEEANTSICPTTWHLPSGSNINKEFSLLAKAYGGTGDNQASRATLGDVMSKRLRSYPNNYVYSARGNDGRFWSRSSWNSTNGSCLRMGGADFSPLEHYAKTSGFAIRCLINP